MIRFVESSEYQNSRRETKALEGTKDVEEEHSFKPINKHLQNKKFRMELQIYQTQ